MTGEHDHDDHRPHDSEPHDHERAGHRDLRRATATSAADLLATPAPHGSAGAFAERVLAAALIGQVRLTARRRA